MRIWWIYNKVEKLVKKYKTRDPEKLIEHLNINLKSLTSTDSLLGMYNVILRNRYIYVSANARYLRNTILAHELGYDMLHRSECVKGRAFSKFSLYNIADVYENEANILLLIF